MPFNSIHFLLFFPIVLLIYQIIPDRVKYLWLLADRIAVFVDHVYGNYQDFGGCYLITATVLFAVQIYCDFAGYSTIAMGAGSTGSTKSRAKF